MVDTLHFRIHDLQIHAHLKDYLLKLYKTGRTKKRIEVDEETGEMVFKNKLVFENLAFLDTGNNFVVNHFNKLKSSHYNIAYKIDVSRDFIEVNVSLPKYYYGTNVIQMIPHLFDREYSDFFHASSFKETIDKFYRIFLKVFMNFLEKNFPNTNLSFVELVRIDFCFNQVFNTKSEALEYFQLLKSRRKKYERENPNRFHYDTSFSSVSRDHSFKVYHKGTEFNKNDRNVIGK